MNNPSEISNIIKSQIENYHNRANMQETGKVILVGDGIARVYGLRNCMANELLQFEGGSLGMAQNLVGDTVSVETPACTIDFVIKKVYKYEI